MTAHEREDYYDQDERAVTWEINAIEAGGVLLSADPDPDAEGHVVVPKEILPRGVGVGDRFTVMFTRDANLGRYTNTNTSAPSPSPDSASTPTEYP